MGGSRHDDEAIATLCTKGATKHENTITGNGKEVRKSEVGELVSTKESSRLNTTDSVPPPLPPRPTIIRIQDGQILESYAPGIHASGAINPTLASRATTAVSTTDVHTRYPVEDGPRGTFSSPASRSDIKSSTRDSIFRGRHSDLASLRSYAPTLETSGDVKSLLGEILGDEVATAWKSPTELLNRDDPFSELEAIEDMVGQDYENEFEEIQTTGDFDEGQSRHFADSRLLLMT
jgi:hypothetical protein